MIPSINSARSTRKTALIAGAILAALACAISIWWPGAITNIASQNYLPHGYCYLWNKQLLTLHVVSDAIIFLTYLAISLSLGWFFFRERRHIPFAWIFVAFGIFIVACGFTHAMDVIVLWRPFYWLAGDIKLITALASLTTAVALPVLIPRVRRFLSQARSHRDNERNFVAATENSQDSFFIFESVRDAAGEIIDFRFTFCNEKGAELVASTPEKVVGQLLCVEFPINVSNGYFEIYKRVVETGQRFEQEFPFDAPNIRASWLRVLAVKHCDGVAITTYDISELKENEIKLTKLAGYTQSILTSSPSATIVTDLNGTITAINPAAERMLLYSEEDLIGVQTPLILLSGGELTLRAAALTEELEEHIRPGLAVLTAKPLRGLVEESEWTLSRKNGSDFDAQMFVSAVKGLDGEVAGLILVVYDITERKRTAEYISFLAHHDALTQLPSRTLLHDRLGVAISRAVRNRNKVGVLVIDLDNFKLVNDLMGHHVGDELLVEVAKRLRAALRTSDTVARMGGDEFVVVLADLQTLEDAAAVAHKLLAALLVPLELGTLTVGAMASIGICVYPDNGLTTDALLKNADAAMYCAKAEGGNCVHTFTAEMESASSRKNLLEVAIRQALAQDEFELVYQPQISLATGKVTGVEALLRWRSASLGVVMPDEFIPVIEKNGLILPIGEWILRTACRQGRLLQLEMDRPLTIAVNISPRQFYQDTLPGQIAQALADYQLPASSLELEVTENILISNSAKPLGVLERTRSLGVKVAIDDFGTGFCSMSYIMSFRVDRLKIDQSFIRDMTSNPESCAVTSAVIALARGLGIPVVAEGVETAAHRDLLVGMGCDEAQGYFYAKPARFEDLAAAIRAIETQSAQSELPELETV